MENSVLDEDKKIEEKLEEKKKILMKKIEKDKYNRRFGDRLYLVRSSANINQRPFTSMLDVSFDRYQAIESGNVASNQAVFVKIADRVRMLFGVEVEDLINDNVEEEQFRDMVFEVWRKNKRVPFDEFEPYFLSPSLFEPISEADPRLLVNVRIGKRIQVIRQSLNINQDIFADSLCISVDRLSSLENGSVLRNFSILIRILLIFDLIDVSFDDLVAETFDKNEVMSRIDNARSKNGSTYVIKAPTLIKI